jgi:hypothetical protein
MDLSTWCVTEINGPDGAVVARFRIDRTSVIGDPMFTSSLWVQVDATHLPDLNSVLQHLDRVEDEVTPLIEREDLGRLLVTLTGAAYRDLVFAVNGDASLAIAPLQARSDRLGAKLDIELFHGQRFGPYAWLVSRWTNQSKAPQ